MKINVFSRGYICRVCHVVHHTMLESGNKQVRVDVDRGLMRSRNMQELTDGRSSRKAGVPYK